MVYKESVPITEDLLEKCKVSRPTLINWLKSYTVLGSPLGIKVGGRWQVFPDRLEKFMNGVHERLN